MNNIEIEEKIKCYEVFFNDSRFVKEPSMIYDEKEFEKNISIHIKLNLELNSTVTIRHIEMNKKDYDNLDD